MMGEMEGQFGQSKVNLKLLLLHRQCVGLERYYPIP